MCGRFFLRPDLDEILAFFDAEPAPGLEVRHPRLNVAPTQQVLGVRLAEDGRRVVDAYRWGLVPPWWKDPHKLPVFLNARAETAASKPSFRSSFRRQRLIVPASGFYEWTAPGGAAKLPHAITLPDGGLMPMAGLWASWRHDGQDLHSATILTTSANAAMSRVHDRMPVILAERDWAAWLDPSSPAETLDALLKPWAGALAIRTVGRGVNNARHADGDWFDEQPTA